MPEGVERFFVETMISKNVDPHQLWEGFKKDRDGLIPAVAQDFITREVLMLAYMDEVSFTRTLQTGLMHYHSRSRGTLWLKGETSGHYQRVMEAKIDCDKDTLLFLVEQTGAACHTGAASCFYRQLEELAGNETKN